MHATNSSVKASQTSPSLRTLDNHIDQGDIGVFRGDTPYHPGAKKKPRRSPCRAFKNPEHLSI